MPDLPSDLEPLSRWTRRLGLSGPQLRGLALEGETPRIYDFGGAGGGIYRVSHSEWAAWLEHRDLVALEATRRLRRRVVRGEAVAVRRQPEHRAHAGARSARPSGA